MSLFDHPKFLIILFVGVIIAIPTMAFLIKQRVSFQSTASNPYSRTVTQISTDSAKEVPKNLPINSLPDNPSLQPTPTPSSDEGLTAQVSFGPTLNFKIIIQGRPGNNHATNGLFVGISSGPPKINPSYLLSFTVKVPASGIYQGLSLAGLTIGNTYTAYLKGPAQIASASAFVVNANKAELNSGLPLNLISGDLNEDNAINDSDYKIAKSYFGSTKTSSNWNENVDLNVDGVINTWDLGIISSNMNKVGAGDLYISRVASGSANLATQSGVLTPPTQGSTGGYWLWVPSF